MRALKRLRRRGGPTAPTSRFSGPGGPPEKSPGNMSGAEFFLPCAISDPGCVVPRTAEGSRSATSASDLPGTAS
jgi:hypothetical protein